MANRNEKEKHEGPKRDYCERLYANWLPLPVESPDKPSITSF